MLFSGGQDSTTCLAWALAHFQKVETIGFDYGQRHRVELDCRPLLREALARDFPAWSGRLGPDHLLPLDLLARLNPNALTADRPITADGGSLPSTFVPGRNLIFLTVAAALAHGRGLPILVGGMCEVDFSGYPDCRDNTLKALQVALSLGMDRPLRLETPLMWRDKAATWALAHQLGGDTLVALVREHTHTCYRGERGVLHPWGHGCGQCPACRLRAAGHAAWTAGTMTPS